MRYVSVPTAGRWAIRDLLDLYKAQKAEERRLKQLTLFELQNDTRPPSQQTASGRWRSPVFNFNPDRP